MESNAVVTKLQSAIANFRREKDAAQRNRDLALERLKTSGTTLENELTKTANLQSRLDDIGRKIAAGNGQEIAQKKAENDRLGREVSEIARRIGEGEDGRGEGKMDTICRNSYSYSRARYCSDTKILTNNAPRSCTPPRLHPPQTDFQHAELVRKKEKLAALQAKMAEESARRAANVRNVRRSVKMWREKNSLQQTTMAITTMEDVVRASGGGGDAAAASATAAAIEKLSAILSDCQERSGGGEDGDSYLALLLNLPRLIDSKVALVADDATDVERKARELRFVADRYRAETTPAVVGAHQGDGSIGDGGEQQPPMAMVMVQQQQLQPLQKPVEAGFM